MRQIPRVRNADSEGRTKTIRHQRGGARRPNPWTEKTEGNTLQSSEIGASFKQNEMGLYRGQHR